MMHLAGKDNDASIDPQFGALIQSWMQNPAQQLLVFVWCAYDQMKTHPPKVDAKDLERSITQLLEPRVRDAMSGDEPFYIQHGSFERETMKPPPAQPPEYDIAFVLRADERVMWPLEAKVLETPKRVAEYVHDVQNEFMTCRYAPFSGSGAMLGYLLCGTPADAFAAIADKLECDLKTIDDLPTKPNRVSTHERSAPEGKPYPTRFNCYHLIMEFPELSRAK